MSYKTVLVALNEINRLDALNDAATKIAKLGGAFVRDIAEFFLAFQSMYEGFIERARSVERLLTEPRTAFVVVSTLECTGVSDRAIVYESPTT